MSMSAVAMVIWGTRHNVPYQVASHVLGLVSFVGCPGVLLTKIWQGPSVRIVYFCLHISVASVSWEAIQRSLSCREPRVRFYDCWVLYAQIGSGFGMPI